MLAEEPLHGAEPPVDPKPALRDRLVEPLPGGPQRAIACSFPHDPVPVTIVQGRAARLAGMCLVRRDPLRLRTCDHGLELRGSTWLARHRANLVDATVLVTTGKALEAERGLRSSPIAPPDRP